MNNKDIIPKRILAFTALLLTSLAVKSLPPAASADAASTSQLPTTIEKKPIVILNMAADALVNYSTITWQLSVSTATK